MLLLSFILKQVMEKNIELVLLLFLVYSFIDFRFFYKLIIIEK